MVNSVKNLSQRNDDRNFSGLHFTTALQGFTPLLDDAPPDRPPNLEVISSVVSSPEAPQFAFSQSAKSYRSDDRTGAGVIDRKSTRLNSSHLGISYAVFCLKKKTK